MILLFIIKNCRINSISYLVLKFPLFLFFCIAMLLGQSNKNSQSKIYIINETKYISALEFANIHKVQTIFYDDKEKLEFRFPKHKVVISPYSSFIRVNDQIFHMSLPVIYDMFISCF